MGVLVRVCEELGGDGKDATAADDVAGVLGVDGDGAIQAVVLEALLPRTRTGANARDGGRGAGGTGVPCGPRNIGCALSTVPRG